MLGQIMQALGIGAQPPANTGASKKEEPVSDPKTLSQKEIADAQVAGGKVEGDPGNPLETMPRADIEQLSSQLSDPAALSDREAYLKIVNKVVNVLTESPHHIELEMNSDIPKQLLSSDEKLANAIKSVLDGKEDVYPIYEGFGNDLNSRPTEKKFIARVFNTLPEVIRNSLGTDNKDAAKQAINRLASMATKKSESPLIAIAAIKSLSTLSQSFRLYSISGDKDFESNLELKNLVQDKFVDLSSKPPILFKLLGMSETPENSELHSAFRDLTDLKEKNFYKIMENLLKLEPEKTSKIINEGLKVELRREEKPTEYDFRSATLLNNLKILAVLVKRDLPEASSKPMLENIAKILKNSPNFQMKDLETEAKSDNTKSEAQKDTKSENDLQALLEGPQMAETIGQIGEGAKGNSMDLMATAIEAATKNPDMLKTIAAALEPKS